jgi:hypothetical protein
MPYLPKRLFMSILISFSAGSPLRFISSLRENISSTYGTKGRIALAETMSETSSIVQPCSSANFISGSHR